MVKNIKMVSKQLPKVNRIVIQKKGTPANGAEVQVFILKGGLVYYNSLSMLETYNRNVTIVLQIYIIIGKFECIQVLHFY
ncbi:hypothetical protein D3C73_650960 [compost metagenome]